MSCSKPEPLYQEQILALGALVDISLWGVEPDAARHAADEITADFNPIFMLSLAGALCSALVLALAYAASRCLPGAGPGALGYSVLAALAHMAGQFAVAYALFIPHPALLHLLPVLMSAAVIFGAVSGIIAQAMLNRVDT